MKKTLIAFALMTAAVWAAPEGNVYHTIADPTWHVTRIGSRWVIEDSKGFFVGYYVPQPAAPVAPVAPAAAKAPATTATPPAAGNSAAQGNSGSSYYNNGAYGNYSGYGFGNYGGYGYNGFYGQNHYNSGNYHYNSNENCQHRQDPPLQPGRDKNDIPLSTPWVPEVPMVRVSR